MEVVDGMPSTSLALFRMSEDAGVLPECEVIH